MDEEVSEVREKHSMPVQYVYFCREELERTDVWEGEGDLAFRNKARTTCRKNCFILITLHDPIHAPAVKAKSEMACLSYKWVFSSP